MTDYTELKRLAEAARSSGADLSDLHIDTERMYTAEYSLIQLYEAATPAVVLALIAENERNQRMLLAACMSMGAISESLGLDMDSDGDEMLGMVAELKAERDQLKVENEALRKDSDRYQWLRDKSEAVHQFYLSVPLWFTGVRFRAQDVDNAIDAMSKGEQS